jgi:adenylate cyclase, class 2
MSFEVEVKYRGGDHADLARRLNELGAVASEVVTHADAYLAHPARDFGQTNEALRIRRIGGSNRITYKGPRRSGPTKTREEIEIAFREGDAAYEQMRQLFLSLGFRPVAVVRKTRQGFHLQHQGRDVEVALDVAEGVGEFVEIEAIAESEADLANAQGVVLDLANALGLTTVEPRSYLRMYLDREAGRG